MNEIRFNSFEPTSSNKEESQKNNPIKITGFKGFIKNILKFFVYILIIAVVVFVGIKIYERFTSNKNESGEYSAVFLSNGQVYFGKIEDNNRKEIVLNNVFYLQTGDNSGSAGESIQGSQFKLIKLGNELHGPTDELFINKQNVLFYEYLRSDSQVVKSIKNSKL